MKEEVVVNGVRVGPDTDLPSLIRTQLLGGSALAGRYDESPEEGIWNLFSAAEGTPIESRLVDAVLTLLSDGDFTVRSGAVNLAQAFAEKFHSADLFAVLKSYHHVPGTVDPPRNTQDLTWGLLRAIAGAKDWTPEVRDRIRSAALDPENGLSVLAGLVNHDASWVIDHGQEIIGDQPTRAEVILFRMKAPLLRERFVRAIPMESPGLRQLVARAVSKEIADDAEKHRLLELLTAG